jgi:hypothetical protein
MTPDTARIPGLVPALARARTSLVRTHKAQSAGPGADGFRGTVVDPGYAVDPVHSSTRKQPQSPDQPH